MTQKQVKCPQCGKPSLFSPENPFRPFCCERCRLIDLGAWAEERFAIPVSAKPDTDTDDDYLDPTNGENLGKNEEND